LVESLVWLAADSAAILLRATVMALTGASA
jgi:hypothetical protein